MSFEINDNIDNTNFDTNKDSNSDTKTTEINSNMAPQTPREFMQMAAPVLNYRFNGDPFKLEAFIADVEIVESLAEDTQAELCSRLVKAKLEGKALEI